MNGPWPPLGLGFDRPVGWDQETPMPKSAPRRQSKICRSCGRAFEWRRKWAHNWDEVRYCSNACRSAGVSKLGRTLEAEILTLLDSRRRGATICPSDVARTVYGSREVADTGADPDDWRELMEPTRRAARRLVADGELEITQRGRVVDPSTARGPIRLRLPD